MEKRLFQFLGLLVAVVLVWQIWHPFWRYDLNEAVDFGSLDRVIVEIPKGSSAKTIAELLDETDVLVSKKSFLRTVKEEDLDGKLRYGRFVLSPGMTLREIISILTTEGTGELALTVIEGWTIEDIDAELTEMGLITSGTFLNCTATCSFDYDFLPTETQSLEGYLFPDTYFLDSANFSVESLINTLLQNFAAKWSAELQADLGASGRTLEEVATMASMLEKEVRTEGDLAIVAGILWKRLDNDWTLGVDATLLYHDEDGELTAADLSRESPYNTRIVTGLPPTAIGNPGLKTLEAALNPEDSPYWFYLTNAEGEVIYASTNEEHEANKTKYLN